MSSMPLYLHRFLAFRPHKPRHALLRLALGVFGLLLLALFVVFGLFIGIGMLLFAAVRRMVRHTPAVSPAVPDMVIEGEYSVVRNPQHLLHPH